ncbi:hypothetical protein M569_02646, partial [Genlisea aurea]
MSTAVFLLWLLTIPLLLSAFSNQQEEPKGFLLTCGSTTQTKEGSLLYTPDDPYISTGKRATLNTTTNILPRLSSLRFFPHSNARKHCYTFPVIKERKYLVRTSYFYGGFDGGKEPPVFDQIIDATRWSVVNTTEDYKNGDSSYYEAVVRTHSKYLSVCLAANRDYTPPNSSPFISSLELRPIGDSLYNSTDFGKNMLVTVARSSFGPDKGVIAFPDDEFDRYWQGYGGGGDRHFVSSQSQINPSQFWNIPPRKAFSTAITSDSAESWVLRWPDFSLTRALYYIALYFQDNRPRGPESWRIFNIHINGEKFYQNLNVTVDGESVVGPAWILEGNTEISMTAAGGSAVAPVISAGEIMQILALGGKTVTRDVVAINGIKDHFTHAPEDWAGDPCLPRENSWTGVSCSKQAPFRIHSLDLTGLGLSGSLPHHIAKLTALKNLWLGNNKFTGEIPDFSELKSLETLHLENNQFEGSIPSTLGELPYLRELFLQNNKINGSLPESLKHKHGINIR